MRRLNAYRSRLFIVFIFIVVAVQISLNLLLSYCGERGVQNVSESKRDIEAKHTDVLRRVYTERLRATQRTITALKVQLKQATTEESQRELNSTEIHILRKQNARLTSQVKKYEKLQKIVNAQEFSKLKSEASKLDFLKGDTPYNELAVVPFDSFTHAGIFSVLKDGLVDRPARRPIGTRIKEHEEILNFALRVLKDELPGQQKIERYNLANGISRLNRITGMAYDLIFTAQPNQYHRVKIRRPFSNLELVGDVETLDTSQEIINLILPLSGRTDNFEIFLKRFGNICVRWDGKVYLTVVYFGKKGREKVKHLLSEFEDREKFNNYKLIFEDGAFSRGVGLQKGVLSWEKGNNIMFFCDVDMFFAPDFLERCRFYTEPGQMVYYPIVFSLYNPEIVYNGNPLEIEQQLRIGKYNGFWRDFGFGMTCVYKNDFVATKGFDTSIHGWGTEDLKLYRKFLKTNLAVIRATDRGIFHMYHQKKCDSSLPSEQYLSCLHSKAVTEASHRQMGMLAFGNRLFSNLEPDWKTKLEYQPDFSLRDSKTKNKRAMSLWRRADELDIEILEVKQLHNRLTAAMNFTVFGKEVFDTKKVNVSALRELQFVLGNVTQVVRKLALAVGKNSTNHG
jgi:chondroitin sulfate N-acetylgalactosaminyltransferase 1/2